jgi:DNA-binding CsgD family transcriptional regulator
MPVLSRLIKVSALVLGAGLVVAGCGPVKLGAAAVVGDQRITVATLNNEVTNLSRYAKLYPGTVQLTPVQETQQTLTWLIRFKINEELAKQQGITISTAQAQKAWAEIFNAAKSSAQSQGITNVTDNLILAANGIPPDLKDEVGRYQAIDDQFALQANGGQAATTQQAQDAVTTKLNQARCVVAKQLKIQVNPQYGRLDYSQYAVVASTPTVTRTAGPTPTASPSGLAPAC